MREEDRKREMAQTHVIERAWERHRLNLTHADVANLGNRIARGQGTRFALPQGNGIGVVVEIFGRYIAVIYVAGLGVQTVLPENSLQVKKALMTKMMKAIEKAHDLSRHQ